ncbi:MAG: hypothetical protein KYQ20_02100 [Candidatus Nealsonbacteria bacterium]|nr:hypothetical protein [Candidatus Nealsonbacteria bacterium]
MFLKLRQNTEKIFWTKHSKRKMQYYNLSEKRVLRILRKPDRIEEGIAPQTIAKMQITGTLKHQTEIWMMYQTLKMRNSGQELKIKIISAWRYPGRTLIGERPIIPEDTLKEFICPEQNPNFFPRKSRH